MASNSWVCSNHPPVRITRIPKIAIPHGVPTKIAWPTSFTPLLHSSTRLVSTFGLWSWNIPQAYTNQLSLTL